MDRSPRLKGITLWKGGEFESRRREKGGVIEKEIEKKRRLSMKNRWFVTGVIAWTLLMGALFMPAEGVSKETAQDWEFVNPEGVVAVKPIEIASRLSSLEGKTVGLKWNTKPNGNLFLDRVAELLIQNVPGVKIIKFYEVEPSTVPQSGNVAETQRKAQIIAKYKPDVVIGSQCD